MKQEILQGLRVLDFSWVLAGPYATRLLADFGAEVIKVQSKKTAGGAEDNKTGYFNAWNRNKRSITLDMSHPEARDIALKLIAMSDVVFENFSPRVMSNWGFDFQSLKEAKSDLIIVRMSAMGQTGPWKDMVAFGPTIQALSGLTLMTSLTEESPLGLGYSYADHIAGLYGALAVLAALEYRERTGRGQYIDLSELEAVCTVMGPALLDIIVNQREVLPEGNRADHLRAAPYGCYPCLGTDRWCVIAVFNEEEWVALCETIGKKPWMKDERFSTLPQRQAHKDALDDCIGQWTIQHGAEQIVSLLQKAGVPAGVVQSAENLACDPHLKARDFFVRLEHPVLGTTVTDASPIRFDDAGETRWKAAPLLGEDNRYVFMDLLGLTESDITAYCEKGIIG